MKNELVLLIPTKAQFGGAVEYTNCIAAKG